MPALRTLALALLVAAAAPAADENTLPAAVETLLDKATEIEVYSLDPERPEKKPKDDFHGWKVLGKTTVKAADDRKAIAAGVRKGVKDMGNPGAKCFEPRHGLRLTHDGKTADLVICFACANIEVVVDGKPAGLVYTTGEAAKTLDRLLTAAKVPLAPKGEPKK